jgi:DNA-binding NarL/FixJ family response regulator
MSLKHRSKKQVPGAQVTPWEIKEAALKIIQFVLSDDPVTQISISEARVYRPSRSRIWQATYTGAEGGQVWRSTGLTNKRQALLVAKRWEAESRAQRGKTGKSTRKPIVRVRGSEPGLSQREVGLLLNLSERAVSQIERRALRKLFAHAGLRQAWHQYLAGELDEQVAVALTPQEVQALFKLTYTTEERLVLQGILKRVQP